MNVLIVANKKDARLYEAVVKSAPNTNLLGAVYSVGKKLLSQIKDRYHPHVIIFDTSVAHMKKTDLKRVVADISSTYPYIKLIVFTADENEARYFKNFCFAVIDNPITNIEMRELLSKAEKSYDSYVRPPEKQPERQNVISFPSVPEETGEAQVLSPDMFPGAFPMPPYNDSEIKPQKKKEDKTDVKLKTLKIILIAAGSLFVICLVLLGIMTFGGKTSANETVQTTAAAVTAASSATEDTVPLRTVSIKDDEASNDEAEYEAPHITEAYTQLPTEESKLIVSATVSSDEVLKLNPSALILDIDQSFVLTAEGGTGKTLKWTSSDKSVATVDQEGNVKAVGGGSAYICVSCGDISDYCLVAVNDKEK